MKKLLLVIFMVLTLTPVACAQPSSVINVQAIREPLPKISPGEAFTAAFEITGKVNGDYRILFESSPTDYTFSGAVVVEGFTPAYYNWGDKVLISKGEKQILNISLVPGGKAMDPRGETFAVKITFLSGEWTYSEKYSFKVE